MWIRIKKDRLFIPLLKSLPTVLRIKKDRLFIPLLKSLPTVLRIKKDSLFIPIFKSLPTVLGGAIFGENRSGKSFRSANRS